MDAEVSGNVARGSAAQRIESELRRAIIAMELPPGARLSEQETGTPLASSATVGGFLPTLGGLVLTKVQVMAVLLDGVSIQKA